MANEIIDLQNEFSFLGQRFRLPSGKVQSVSINGQTNTPDSQGNVDLGTVVGEQGPQGETGPAGPQGNSGVASADGVIVVNNLTEGGTDVVVNGVTKVKVLSAEMGKQLAADVDDIPVIDIHVDGRKLVINTNAALAPRVIVGSLSKSALSCRAGNTDTATFKVSGRRLTAAITAALSDSTHFSISPASISPSSGIVEETTLTVTYNPGSGATAGTSHSLTITIASGGVTYGTLELTGTVAAAPSITLTPASLTIRTESGQSGTGTINVKGTALDGDISLAISGSGFSLSSSTVAKAEGESAGGKDITVTFDGSADGATGTITASSTGAANATASIIGEFAERESEGTEFTIDGLTYTVLADTTKVSVKAASTSLSGNVVIPSSVMYNGMSYAVTEMPRNAFNGTAITGITLPDTITSLADYYTFQLCTNLVSVNLGNGVTSLGQQAFIGCSSLQRIVIPDQVTNMGGGTFKGCSSLTEIQIGTSSACAISTLNGALNGASSNGQFSTNNSVLRTIICYAITPPSFGSWGTDALPAEYLAGGTLKVPSGSMSAYQSATLWSQIPNKEAITE